VIETAGGEVFAKRSIKQGPAFLAKEVDGFSCYEEQSFLRSTMQTVAMAVSEDAERTDFGLGDRRFRYAALGRNVDLYNARWVIWRQW